MTENPPAKPLFRREAVTHQQVRLDGEVIIAQPVMTRHLLIALLTAIAIAIAFLALSSFPRKETVTGYLQPIRGVSDVVALRNGLVAHLLIDKGQYVSAGQPLMEVTIPQHLNSGEELKNALKNSISTQKKLVALQHSESLQQFKSRNLELVQQIEGTERLLQHNETQLNSLQRIKDLQQQRLDRLERLGSGGHVSRADIDQQTEQLLVLSQQESELDATQQRLTMQLQQLNNSLERLPLDKEIHLSSLQSQLSKLNEQEAELAARSGYMLVAPKDGMVTDLLTQTGTSVRAGEVVMRIMPQDAALQATLLLPTRAFGFIEQGQQVWIRYDAFPYQRFGLQSGAIESFSRTLRKPGDPGLTVSIEEPVYPVVVALDSQAVKAYGKEMPLQPGMLLSADIVLEQRSAISWLLEPLISLRGQL